MDVIRGKVSLSLEGVHISVTSQRAEGFTSITSWAQRTSNGNIFAPAITERCRNSFGHCCGVLRAFSSRASPSMAVNEDCLQTSLRQDVGFVLDDRVHDRVVNGVGTTRILSARTAPDITYVRIAAPLPRVERNHFQGWKSVVGWRLPLGWLLPRRSNVREITDNDD